MKLFNIASIATAAALVSVVGVAAQSGTFERKEKTKVEVKGGKEIKVTGCLDRVSTGTGYILTDSSGDRLKYAIVTDDDLSKYIGKRVEAKGNASDRGDAKVKVERKVEGTTGEKTESKVETSGANADLPFLGLHSIKAVEGSCP